MRPLCLNISTVKAVVLRVLKQYFAIVFVVFVSVQ